MRQSAYPRTGLFGLVLAASLLAGCGDGDADVSTGGGDTGGVLTLACPGSVTAGARTTNGFSASLIQPNGTPVSGTFVGLTASPESGTAIFAPASATAATAGAPTDAQGRLGFAFAVPSGTATNTRYQLTARVGSQSKSCQVTVQAASLQFAAPVSGSVQNVCTPARLTAASTASDNIAVRVAGTVDVAASNGGLLTTSPTACTGTASLSGVAISGDTGDFQTPLYVVARAATTTTVTLTDTTNAARTASLDLQFVDQPSAISLDTDVLQVNPSPAASRFASLTATVTNAAGRAIAGQPVVFAVETPAGGANADRVNPTTATTGPGGAATARYEAGSNTGNATVRVCVRGSTSLCDRRTITVTTASTGGGSGGTGGTTASRLILDANPLQVSASPADARFSALTATVYDASNRLLAGQAVTFTVETPVGGINPDRVNPPGATTGSAGTATSRYEAGSNAGNATILACVQSTGVCDRRTITVTGGTSGGTGSPARVTLEADPTQVNASPSPTRYAALKAMVYDASNRGLSGRVVTFTLETRAGGGTTDQVDPASGTTDANGAATSRYEAGTTTGSATIAACVQGTLVCGRQTVAVNPAPTPGQVTRLVAMADTAQLYAQPTTRATTSTITATAFDGNGQPVPGQLVTFAFQTQTGGNPSDDLSTRQATTNDAGVAQTRYTTGSLTGRATVRASVQGTGFFQDLDFTVSDGAGTPGTGTEPASLALSTTRAQVRETQAGATPDETNVSARVLDASGRAVPGKTVTFAFQDQTGGSPSDALSAPTATTDNSGTATVQYRAGGNSGKNTASISACVPATPSNVCTGGAGAPNLTITTVRPATLALTATPSTISAAPSTANSSALVATLRDSAGNVVAGASVTFTLEGSPGGATPDSLSPPTATTSTSGTAGATYRAGSNAGAPTIRACLTSNGNICASQRITVNP